MAPAVLSDPCFCVKGLSPDYPEHSLDVERVAEGRQPQACGGRLPCRGWCGPPAPCSGLPAKVSRMQQGLEGNSPRSDQMQGFHAIFLSARRAQVWLSVHTPFLSGTLFLLSRLCEAMAHSTRKKRRSSNHYRECIFKFTMLKFFLLHCLQVWTMKCYHT